HQRVEQVREQLVEEAVWLGQDAPLVDVLVHHERVGAEVVELHGDVEDAVDVGEAVVEEDGARHRSRKVDDEVRDHGNVRLVPGYPPGPGNVRLQDVFVERRRDV